MYVRAKHHEELTLHKKAKEENKPYIANNTLDAQ